MKVPGVDATPKERGVFEPLRETLLTRGDRYMHLADLKSYLEADGKLVELYRDPHAWARKAILNIASSGKFSSDRTIAEYAATIWGATPCPVDAPGLPGSPRADGPGSPHPDPATIGSQE